MSSLAGALGDAQPQRLPKLDDDVAYSPVAEEDVEMGSPTGGNPAELQEEDEEMDDLFGNDEGVEEAKQHQPTSPSASAPDSERLATPERERRQALEYGEEEAPQEIAVEVKEAEVSFPNIPVPKSSDGDNWVIRVPNFVRVDSKPFHPDTYIGPEHEDEDSHPAESIREKSMTIKLRVENTVRWRWIKDENGLDRRQSNSRVIRWSDGTLSLRLGKELFDINQSRDTSAGVPRQFIGSQSSQPAVEALVNKQGLTYLVAQHKRSQVLQSEAVITGYMTLRPTGMQSETHRMLVRAVGQKHNKVARLRMAPDPTMDPEREKLELMKQSAKKSKKKSDYDDMLGGGRKRRYSRKTAGRDVWSDDEEDEAAGIFEGSDEEHDEGAGTGSSGRKPKRKVSEDKKGLEDYQEDDFVVADSSDEDAGPRGRKRKSGEGDDDEEDPLDRLDAKIREQQESHKKRRESGSKGDTRGDDDKGADKDVESEEEEDEEEFKVRRLGGTGTRKRGAVFDEDEEE
ncbi:RNA polymerase-associated protein LEO1 [Hypsizygus marmoreus]|uniref:RNA polymerase-associated protein LEO1 n=1 Tax=Hypsizygus marmoreus TaxID=39966 RepID=A0A369JNQ6_HYPMA|nr:RNA polymerase-associated protein LEO1 [Hypsizygus marmoreus]